MSRQRPANIAASVRHRLLNHARTTNTEYNLVEVRYAIERLLYRLSISNHRDSFLLKGAMLFVLWEGESHRPTRDLDLLCQPYRDLPEIEEIFRAITQVSCPDDGLFFDPKSVSATEIREDNAYGGIRVIMTARLGSGRVPIQVDIGLGDPVTPEADWEDYPSLLDFPRPVLRAYPIYTVVAEKFEAIVKLGLMNSRMKDYYDLLYLQGGFEFDRALLRKAIEATFKQRGTPLPTELPQGLTEAFFDSPDKTKQWQAFVGRNRLNSPDLPTVAQRIAEFLMSALRASAPDDLKWMPDSGWTEIVEQS